MAINFNHVTNTISASTGNINIGAGANNQIVYQSLANTTSFITAPTTAYSSLMWNGTSFAWSPMLYETVVAISGATTIDVDFNLASNKYNTFAITLSSGNAATINFKNLNTVSSSTVMFSFNVILKNSSTALASTTSITWQFGASTTMSSSISWAGGSTARPPSTTTASATDIWSFFTYDGGATLVGSLAMKDVKSA